MIIYKTTNKVNSKCYVGKDSHNDPDYLGSGVYLSKAINKYGRENFVKETIDSAETSEEINKKEKRWIKFYNSVVPSGYNLTEGGDGFSTGELNVAKRPEIREKISAKSKEFHNRLEIKEKMLGKNNPAKRQEVKDQISEAKIGKSRPDITGNNNPSKRLEVKEKQSRAHRGRSKEYMRGEYNPAKRPEVREKISEKLKAAWLRRKEQ